MKKQGVLSVVIGLSIAFCLTFVPSSGAEKPIELTFSVFFPPTHAHAIASMEMAKEIEDNLIALHVDKLLHIKLHFITFSI